MKQIGIFLYAIIWLLTLLFWYDIVSIDIMSISNIYESAANCEGNFECWKLVNLSTIHAIPFAVFSSVTNLVCILPQLVSRIIICYCARAMIVWQCAVFGCSNGDNYTATVDEKYIRSLHKMIIWLSEALAYRRKQLLNDMACRNKNKLPYDIVYYPVSDSRYALHRHMGCAAAVTAVLPVSYTHLTLPTNREV